MFRLGTIYDLRHPGRSCNAASGSGKTTVQSKSQGTAGPPGGPGPQVQSSLLVPGIELSGTMTAWQVQGPELRFLYQKNRKPRNAGSSRSLWATYNRNPDIIPPTMSVHTPCGRSGRPVQGEVTPLTLSWLYLLCMDANILTA